VAHHVEMRIARTLLALLVVSLSATASAHGPPAELSPPGEANRLLGTCRGEELVGETNVPPPFCARDASGAHGSCGIVWGDGEYFVEADFCDASGALASASGPAYVCAIRWTRIWSIDTHEMVLPWRAGTWPRDAQARLAHARSCFTRRAAGASR